MVETLLVNCYLDPSKVQELHRVIKNFSQCIVVEYHEVEPLYKMAKEVDAVVLSGSEARIVKPKDREKFGDVIKLIMDMELPLFGICFGHQLLCLAYGAGVAPLKEPVRDVFEDVRIIAVDEIFEGFKEGESVPLAEYHNDYVLKDGLEEAGLMLLADSESCEVEAVKRKDRPFYGVQFHPERIKIGERVELSGHRIIQNFYKNVIRS